MAKKKSNRTKKPVSGISTQIRADVKPDTPSYYVNYMAVNHSPYDFTITAIKLPSHFTPDQIELANKRRPVPVEPILQLVIPPRIIKGLINALSDQCQKFEDRFGAITSKGEK